MFIRSSERVTSLTWIPINIHFREAAWSASVTAHIFDAHVAGIGAGVVVKHSAVPIGVWLNPAPEGAVIDRLNIGLSGEYVKGPGGVVNAGLDKLLRGEGRVVNGSWIRFEISPAVTFFLNGFLPAAKPGRSYRAQI